MSEELIQRNLISTPEKMGTWDFYNIGATTLKALKVARIIPDRDYDEYETKKPDALIIKKPQVIVAIEYKQPKELRTQKQIEAAIAQEMGTARALGAKIYVVTDGQKTFWINPLTGKELQLEDGGRISLPFDKNDVECIRLIHKAIGSIHARNNTVFASAVVDPLPLAQKVWQDLWAVSGATPENCLYTFVELFIFKYLSDLGVLKGVYSFSSLLQQYKTNTENEVIENYASFVRKKIKEYFPSNPQDKTTIINGTIFVSKDDQAVSGYATVFRKSLERFQDFGTLENIDYDFKSKLFETFLKESISKKNWGQFFTPLKVVRAITRMADIRPGMKICDPACGVGKFLLDPLLHDLHRYITVENDTLKQHITLCGFDKGFDKDEQKTIILAKANMLIYLSTLIRENSGITKQFAHLFNETFLLQTNSILGTLAHPIVDEYDLILTNPPYVMSGSSNLKDEIGKKTPLEQHYAISAMGVEGLFMEWIVRALKPGGKAFVIVPDGIMNRSNDKRLRDFILEECDIDVIISLPLNTFFTTNKKTYILALTKKVPVMLHGIPSKKRQTAPVFTYLCSEIGETRDTYRFDIEQNDLDTGATLFNMFKNVRGVLPVDDERFNDKRCKIVSIDEFYTGTHWSVERWWSREEKIALRIEDETITADINQFISMISDLADSINEYQEPLLELEKKKTNWDYKSTSLANTKHFQLVTSAIGLNRTLLEQIDTCDEADIPVYTGGKAPVVHVRPIVGKKPIHATVANQILSFASNGENSGSNFVLHTRDFYINADRIAIIAEDAILPRYLLSQLFNMKKVYRFNWSHKANRHNLAVVNVPIPTNRNDKFDIEKQAIIAEQFTLVAELKNYVELRRRELSDLTISIDLSSYTMKNFLLSELLEPIKGKSKYTRKYGELHKGDYAVYSASANTPLTYINTFDYDGTYLSWSTNGFAGAVIILDGKFSINGDRGILLPQRKDVSISYLKYILEPVFRSLAKGRKGERGADEFTKLYPSMINDVLVPLPVDETGTISLSLQREIAEQFEAVERCKSQVLEKLQALISQPISY